MGNADAKVGSGGWRNVFKIEDGGDGNGSGEGGREGNENGGGASGTNGFWVGDGGAGRRAWERRAGDGRGVWACVGAETWRREQR